ncbi:MAG: hypothetical protein SH857_16005 [Chitinophagales bacterium]|nr:hypothetical protein [Chitinophagales bacterium]
MKNLIWIINLLIPLALSAQSDSVKYFNQYWKETTKDSARFYRAIKQEENRQHVMDYYISGTLQMEGDYSSLQPEIQEGYFVWYFETGQKFVEGNFVHGQREGIWTFWYPDGLKKQEIKFLPGKQEEYVFKWRSKREKNSIELIEKAIKKMKRGNIEAAESLLNSAIGFNPYSTEAFYQLGLLKCSNYRRGAGCNDLIKAKKFGFFDNEEINKAIEGCCLW